MLWLQQRVDHLLGQQIPRGTGGVVSTQGRNPWMEAKVHLQRFLGFFLVCFFFNKIESVNLAPQTYREKNSLAELEKGGRDLN